MPTPDKAGTVMTRKHLLDLGNARKASHCYPPESPRHGYIMPGKCDHRECNRLRDIEQVVCYLVDHPERLAGEDEVVVKREEHERLLAAARGEAGDTTARLMDAMQQIDNQQSAIRECYSFLRRYLSGNGGIASAKTVMEIIEKARFPWLAGSPTAQEEKDSV